MDRIALKGKKIFWTLDPASEAPTNLVGLKLSHRIADKHGNEIAHAGRKLTPAIVKEMQKAKVTEVEVEPGDLEGAFTTADIVDTATGEVLLEANSELTTDRLARILDAGITEVQVFFPERDDVGTVISEIGRASCRERV